MKRIVLAAIALAFASPAVAQDYITIWNPQSTALPGYTDATVIQDFESPDVANGTDYTGYTLPGVFTDQSVPPGPHKPRTAVFQTSDAPLSGMDGQYIGVVSGSDYIIEFLQGGVQFFSFVFNGLSENDKLTLYFSDGTSQDIIGHDILTGGDVIGLPNNQIPTPPDDWGRVSYDMNNGDSIIKAAFTSGSGFWYIDSIAFAAPEASTWAMLIVGFGFAGWQLRVRRRKPKLAYA